MSTTIDMALKMEEILDVKLIEPLEILKKEFSEIPTSDRVGTSLSAKYSSFERYIFRVIKRIGFDVFTTIYAPFSAVS